MFQRRLGVLLVSAAAGYGVWKWAPGTELGRTAFKAVAGSFANPLLFVSGNGTHESPWFPGAKNAATAAVLAWEAPDPIGLAAMEMAPSPDYQA